jgi:DNA (cytosine-5)-methyltransferase 1
MQIKFKKVYSVSKKAEKPRLWLQHIVCEAADLKPGDPLYIQINEEDEQILIQNYDFERQSADHVIHVASRKNRISGKERPLVDTSGDRYNFLDVKQKVEISVFKQGTKSQIIIQPLCYSLFNNETIPTQKDERIRLLSVCAGSGIGTACLRDTQYFTPIQEIELEDDSAEVLLHNFSKSTVFCGDLRDCMNIAEVDLALVTLPCNEHSNLGYQEGNVMNDLILATSKIIKSSTASMIFFENVPKFYRSESWFRLKELLRDEYPFWTMKNIEAWDFGSIATRNRTYAVACKDQSMFHAFDFPAAPKMRRRKLKDFLDPAKIKHEWKSLDKWMESFKSREAWKDRDLSRTFVTKDVNKISCVPARYTAHSASSSYVLHEDGKHWRFLTIDEIKRILNVPEWYEFCDHTPKVRKYEMLGQGVDGTVFRAIGNKIANAFMKVKTATNKTAEAIYESCSVNSNGQLELFI